jgi:ribonuclease HI
MMGDSLLKVYTDASWSHDIGTWAILIGELPNGIKIGGTCSQPIKNSNEAELFAIHKVLERVPQSSQVLLHTDSLVARNLLLAKPQRLVPESFRVWRDLIWAEIETRDLTVQFIWITKNVQIPVQEPDRDALKWCDGFAKRLLRESLLRSSSVLDV